MEPTQPEGSHLGKSSQAGHPSAQRMCTESWGTSLSPLPMSHAVLEYGQRKGKDRKGLFALLELPLPRYLDQESIRFSEDI